jgi:hypothetical protein
MRGSIVVLALAITPLVARVSQAQHRPHWQRHDLPAVRRDRHDDDRNRGKSDDKKCEERSRGNPSQNGFDHRADPRAKGNKDCDLSSGNGGGEQPPPPPPPPADTLGHTQIQGSVYFDVDHDGALGSDEVGLSGWTVEAIGPMIVSTVTDGNGAYSISGLTAGSYTVCVMAPMGWGQTAPSAGLGLPTCSNATVGIPLDAPLTTGETLYTGVDFGFFSM